MVLDYVIYLKKIAKPSIGKAKRGQISVCQFCERLFVGIYNLSLFDFHEITTKWKRLKNTVLKKLPII